jgi:hypothetical protein
VLNYLRTTPWRRIGKWRYRSTFRLPQLYLEVSGQHHAPAALPPLYLLRYLQPPEVDSVTRIKYFRLVHEHNASNFTFNHPLPFFKNLRYYNSVLIYCLIVLKRCNIIRLGRGIAVPCSAFYHHYLKRHGNCFNLKNGRLKEVTLPTLHSLLPRIYVPPCKTVGTYHPPLRT